MKDFAIISDTTCDVTDQMQEKYGLVVLPGHLGLPDKRDIESFTKWEVMGREEFYSELKKDPDGFTTAPPSVAVFAKAFEDCVSEGKGVLCLTISGSISGTYNFTALARDEVLKKYPDAEISIVDSLRFGPAMALMMVDASVMRSEGMSLTEVTEQLERKKNTYHQAGWLDDLSFIAKQGRLNHGKAFLGTLAGVKPIGEFDYNGLTTVIGKVKGAKTAYSVLLSYIEKTITEPEKQMVFVAHTNRYEQAKQYKAMIEERIRPKEVLILDVFPSCGVNVGPGLMAAYYTGKPISEGLLQERSIIEKAMNEVAHK